MKLYFSQYRLWGYFPNDGTPLKDRQRISALIAPDKPLKLTSQPLHIKGDDGPTWSISSVRRHSVQISFKLK